MVIHKSFSEFVLFLYVHMAMADGGVHVTEENIILEKMNKLFPPDKDKKLLLNEATSSYKAMASDEVQRTIEDTFKHFSEVPFAIKYKVYTDMYDIINADGIVDESETKTLADLKRIIDVSVAAR